MKEFIVQVTEDIEFDPEGNVSLKSKIVGEIVRCKDCKYYVANECRHPRAMVFTEDNDFCSYAERRINE